MFGKVLIANRGEIALRIHRACQEMGIRTVAIHSLADADAMHVRLADESVCVGPAQSSQSYMNIPAILSACTVTEADAVHPGYGFLSENADFAQIVKDHGIAFIGPEPSHIGIMGDKVIARDTMLKLGIPCVPGSDGVVKDYDSAIRISDGIGYPVLIKAVNGGGGRGMRVVWCADDLLDNVKAARAEAESAFGSGAVYIEKYLSDPRHIEVQIIADRFGHVIHLGERDCSIQRRHQKLIEEAPSPIITASQRKMIGDVCTRAIKEIGYIGVGTLEFLYENGEFYFIEMNTRLQVEHPVTEESLGIDIVQEQIRVAYGEQLSPILENKEFSGHSIECRINAENSETFIPSPGIISRYHAPSGRGVRVESAIYGGYSIPPYYDSMIGKLIVHAPDRLGCIRKLQLALKEFVIDGVDTSIPLLQRIISSDYFLNGNYSVKWLENFISCGEDTT